MLHQLHGRLPHDQSLLCQRDEKRPTGFTLLLTRPCGAFFVDIYERDRSLRAIKFRVDRSREDDLAVARQQVDRFPIPEGAERTGQPLRGNRVKGPVEREEARIATEVS